MNCERQSKSLLHNWNNYGYFTHGKGEIIVIYRHKINDTCVMIRQYANLENR